MTRRQERFRITKFRRIYDRREGKFVINIAYETATEVTPRTLNVAEAFGLGIDQTRKFVIYDNVELKIGPTDIVYITGESGSGKSVLLRAMKEDLGEEALDIAEIKVDPDKPIIETVGATFDEGLKLLSRVGLNDAYLFIRRYCELSEGQKYRYRIAKLIKSGKQYWIMDEFCATLDRETAKIVAFNVQKQARRTGKAVLAATTHTDLFEDLAPSVHIHKGWGRRVEVKYYPNMLNRICSITRGLTIEEGSVKDYKRLAEFHYRNPKTMPVPMKVYVLKRRRDGMTVGVIMYSWPPPAVFGRRKAFGRRVSIEEANRKIANIGRVVLHPKYRSIGLGVRLVKETLPLLGRPYIEAVAVMAKYNPFFEKAGMEKIAESHGDKTVREAVKRLEELGFKPYALASPEMNLKQLKTLKPMELKRVKEALMKVSPGYYKRLKATGELYSRKDEFTKFITEAPLETLAKVISRLAVLAQKKVYLLWRRPRD